MDSLQGLVSPATVNANNDICISIVSSAHGNHSCSDEALRSERVGAMSGCHCARKVIAVRYPISVVRAPVN
jgi:hypothetical protein